MVLLIILLIFSVAINVALIFWIVRKYDEDIMNIIMKESLKLE